MLGASFRVFCQALVSEYLKKGSQVYIEGSLRTRKWQDKEGRDRYTTEIIASDMQMMGSRGGGGGGGGGGASGGATGNFEARERSPVPEGVPAGAGASAEEFDDDIPF